MVVGQRLKICCGSLSPEAITYKHHVIEKFGSTMTDLWKKRTLLLLACNGDWRCGDSLEYFINQPGALQQRSAIVNFMTTSLQYIFGSCKPHLYPRSRWTGSTRAIDDLLLMEALHNMLSACYSVYLNILDGDRSSSQSRASGTTSSGLGRGASAHDMDNSEPVSDLQQDGVSSRVADEGSVPLQDSSEGASSFAQINAQDRQKAQQWLASKPLGVMMAMRYTLEPLAVLLHAQLELSGEEWELKQHARLLRGLSAGGLEPSETGRSFPLEIAAWEVHEARFFTSITDLFSSTETWQHVPTQDRTVSFRALCFRMLSRAACCIAQNFQHKHQQFPFRLFKAISQPALVEGMLAVRQCCVDPWSLQILARFGHRQDLLQKVLVAHASQCKTGIAHVEAGHASVRRVLKAKSVQTHALSIMDSGVAWVFQHFRRQMQKGKTRHMKVHMNCCSWAWIRSCVHTHLPNPASNDFPLHKSSLSLQGLSQRKLSCKDSPKRCFDNMFANCLLKLMC